MSIFPTKMQAPGEAALGLVTAVSLAPRTDLVTLQELNQYFSKKFKNSLLIEIFKIPMDRRIYDVILFLYMFQMFPNKK